MSNYSWAKVWIEIIYDYKMAGLSDRLWRRTIELILLAKEQDPIEGYLPNLDEMAFKLRSHPAELTAELTELAQLGITKQLDSGWFLPNFRDRQRSMTGAERVALHRERRKRQEYNEPETEVKRAGNDSVTNRYTEENRIDKEESKSKVRTEPDHYPTHPPITK
jgi:hypothetical protein